MTKTFTFSVPARFVFDVIEDDGDVVRASEKAAEIIHQANRSDNWSACDVDGVFPRVSVAESEIPPLEEEYNHR